MNIKIVSSDQALQQVCASLLYGYSVSTCDTPLDGPEGDLAPGEFCIWDFSPQSAIPNGLDTENVRKYLFVAHRRDLGLLRNRTGRSDINVILKPVTRATLSAFLSEAMESKSFDEPGNSCESLRTDRDEMLQCLIQANLKLQEYEQGRTNFLARAVHDFRAPLTAVSGYCGLLLADVLGPLSDDQKEVLRRMQHSSQRLSRMASAMYQVSVGRRVESRPNFQPGDLRECLDQALHEVMPYLQEKHLSVEVDFQPSPDCLCFERAQLEQVFLNLLDNACKYTPRNGSISIHGAPYFWERRRNAGERPQVKREQRRAEIRDANAFRVEIEDSGPGIPPEHLVRIFEEYATYSGGTDRSGGGLGLAISKMIIDGHHGLIWSDNTSTGALFCFLLPFGLVAKPKDCDEFEAAAVMAGQR